MGNNVENESGKAGDSDRHVAQQETMIVPQREDMSQTSESGKADDADTGIPQHKMMTITPQGEGLSLSGEKNSSLQASAGEEKTTAISIMPHGASPQDGTALHDVLLDEHTDHAVFPEMLQTFIKVVQSPCSSPAAAGSSGHSHRASIDSDRSGRRSSADSSKSRRKSCESQKPRRKSKDKQDTSFKAVYKRKPTKMKRTSNRQ